MKREYYWRNLGLIFLFFFSVKSRAENDSIQMQVGSYEIRESNLDWLEKMQEVGVLSGDEETDRLGDWQNELQELEEWKENPINLNEATKKELERFPFLSDFQIEKLLQYLYVSGPMKTIYELQLVEGMDYETIQFILPYVYVSLPKEEFSIPSVKNIIKYGKHEFITRWDVPLYLREGYKRKEDKILQENPNKHYVGSPWYHSLRYAFHYRDQLFCGITAEKDAGEPFFKGVNKKGYDSYSFYLFIRDLGRFRTLAIGKYRVTFGQGLVIGSEYLFGKGVSINTMNNRNTGFKKHSSTDEYNYFRGVGTTYVCNDRIDFSAFYSHRSLDGIADDTVLTSITTTGKHTVPREIERKNAAVLQTAGGNIRYVGNAFQIGFTGVYYAFNKRYDPQYRLYTKYYFRGKQGYNAGIDYKFHFRNTFSMGEVAMDRNGNLAMLHSLRYTFSPAWQIVALYRYYDMKYQTFYARSISEGGKVQNETGLYLGSEMKLLRNWKFTGYLDFFRFPYLKYLVDKPSSGFEGSLQTSYTPFRSLLLTGYYRYKRKEKNYMDSDTKEKSVLPYRTQRVQLQGNYSLHSRCTLKTTFQWVQTGTEGHSMSQGTLIAQNIGYRMEKIPLLVDFTFSFFNTDEYASRVYSYEKGLLYSFYVPSFYGKGTHLALTLRYDCTSHFMILCKYGQTVYSDRDHISSGLEEISGCRKKDLNFQFRWKF